VDTLTPVEALRAKVAETREAFERAASASYLHDDPAKDQLLAMGLAIDAMLQICEINDASQKSVTASMEANIKEIAGKATQQLIEQAGPDVAEAIESATRFHLKTVRLRSLLGGAAGVLVGAAWSSLMANNDPVQALAACKKSVVMASDGRHYCSMPIWLDRQINPS
jgi:hypothetical protein